MENSFFGRIVPKENPVARALTLPLKPTRHVKGREWVMHHSS
jgi:hypothetical protein